MVIRSWMLSFILVYPGKAGLVSDPWNDAGISMEAKAKEVGLFEQSVQMESWESWTG